MEGRHDGAGAEAGSTATEVESTSDFEAAIGAGDTVLVDFYAEWCGPCTMMEPVLESVADEADSAVLKVDVETLPELATRYEVNAVPTFLVFRDEDVTERLVGMTAADELLAAVE